MILVVITAIKSVILRNILISGLDTIWRLNHLNSHCPNIRTYHYTI